MMKQGKDKMKRIALVFAFVLIALIPNAFAAITSCTLNNPSANQFDNGQIVLNVTAIWSGGNNLTNVTYTIGSTIFSNFTINGTSTNLTAGATALKGDFTYTLVSSSLTANTAYTTYATCYNETEASNVNVALNSTSVTYTVDTSSPSVKVSNPLPGSTVIPNSNIVTFEYTPTDTNIGNCTYHINNVQQSSSNFNVTSGTIARFAKSFATDNSSVRIAVNCNDKAGLASLSSSANNFTFNVLLGSVPYAVRQLQAQQMSGGGGGIASSSSQSSSQGFAGVSIPSSVSTNFQNYAWVYVVVIVIIGAFAVRKFKKK